MPRAPRVWAALLATMLCIVVCAPSSAQSVAPGSITVVVTDAASGAPIENAEVFLLGGDSQSSLTDSAGKLAFPSVDPGSYRIAVRRSNYDQSEISAFDVREGARVTIGVKLRSSLKVIGSVTARPAVVVSEESINDDGPDRKISQSLLGALGRLAGVSVDQSYENGAFNISLRNHDPSQTGIAIDGVRLAGPATQALGAAQGLFTGATVNFNPTAAYLGGTVNFHTLQPTKAWTANATGTIGNLGASGYSFAVTGSAGRFSTALQHAMNGSDSPLDGVLYGDQSGRLWEHHAGSRTGAELAKLSYAASKRTTIDLSAMFTNSGSRTTCSNFVTLYACGYGDAPVDRNTSAFQSLGVTSLIGNVQSTFYAGVSSGTFRHDDAAPSLDGSALPPSLASGQYVGSYYGARGSITARRHTNSFGLFSQDYRQSIAQTYDGVPISVAQAPVRHTEIYLSDRVKANEKLALAHGLSLASATGAGRSLVLSETADWTPKQNDVYEANLSSGSAQPNYRPQRTIADPASADYDCYNHSVFVAGPNDSNTPQSSLGYDLSWRHKFRAGRWTFSVYRQNALGQSYQAAVPAGAEPSSIFPGGVAAYVQQLQQFWSAPTVCGNTPFSPSGVYVSQSVSGLATVNQGMTFSAEIRGGRNVSFYPTYALGSTYLSSLDARLAYPGSFYATGSQLPKKPLRTAGLIADTIVPKAGAEFLVGAQFNSVNNASNLPSYTVFNAGLVLRPRYGGTITIVESNVFGTHAGLFTTYQGTNPLPLVGGGTFAYSTSPLAPRQWSVTWRMPWKQRTAAGGRP